MSQPRDPAFGFIPILLALGLGSRIYNSSPNTHPQDLTAYFSEFALFKYRIHVEIEYFIALSTVPLPQLRCPFPLADRDMWMSDVTNLPPWRRFCDGKCTRGFSWGLAD